MGGTLPVGAPRGGGRPADPELHPGLTTRSPQCGLSSRGRTQVSAPHKAPSSGPRSAWWTVRATCQVTVGAVPKCLCPSGCCLSAQQVRPHHPQPPPSPRLLPSPSTDTTPQAAGSAFQGETLRLRPLQGPGPVITHWPFFTQQRCCPRPGSLCVSCAVTRPAPGSLCVLATV